MSVTMSAKGIANDLLTIDSPSFTVFTLQTIRLKSFFDGLRISCVITASQTKIPAHFN